MPAQNGAPDFERFRDYLLALARARIEPRHRAKVGASDVVQETMIEAHRDWGEFRGKVDAELVAWLRRILAHNLADALKAAGAGIRDVDRECSFEERFGKTTGRLGDWLRAPGASPTARLSQEERALLVSTALTHIDDDQREAIELRYLLDLPLKEMAAHMGRSELAVAGLLHRGKDRLRELLQGRV